jgi:hypothetical protein
MIELTKTIVERLIPADLIKSAFSQFKRQRTADIGADIFCVYYTLNKVYVTAEQLLDQMDRAVHEFDTAQAEGRAAQVRHQLDAVSALVRRQSKLLASLVQHYAKLDAKMHLLDRASHLVLEEFFGGKVNLFRGIDAILAPSSDRRLEDARTALVLAHEREAVDAALRRSLTGRSDKTVRGLLSPRLPGTVDEQLFSHIDAELQRLDARMHEAGTVRVLYPDVFAIFRHYLAGGARESMASVKEALDHLYAAIKANFSVEDLLMKVGDARMRGFE